MRWSPGRAAVLRLQTAAHGWKYSPHQLETQNPSYVLLEGAACALRHAAVVGRAVDVEPPEDSVGGAAVLPEGGHLVK